MAIHFVSTTVLSSDNGIDFSKEIRIESEESKRIRAQQDKSNSKPLFQQLAERQEEKDLEREKITKLIFAPPKGLDDEEFQ